MLLQENLFFFLKNVFFYKIMTSIRASQLIDFKPTNILDVDVTDVYQIFLEPNNYSNHFEESVV